jgi:hypothetical protein
LIVRAGTLTATAKLRNWERAARQVIQPQVSSNYTQFTAEIAIKKLEMMEIVGRRWVNGKRRLDA